MNYEEAMVYINQLNTKGIALGLERITVLLDILGNPQDALRCVHVAGTNGKGSVCAFLDSALQKAGLRVGRYISPTLYGYLERFQINGIWMAEADFAGLLKTVQHACKQMEAQNLEVPTVFEVETAIAFLYFKQQNCDYVLLETGMGGRLDSTNVIKKPAVSVITPVSLDHTAMLGGSLEEIAAEKGGIIKPGCPVVLGPQKAEVLDVLLGCCKKCGVDPVLCSEADVQNRKWSLNGQQFTYRGTDLAIRLLGDYQCSNAVIALETLRVLQKTEPVLTETAMRNGLKNAAWAGRFEMIHINPTVIVDGAHNPAGAQALADTLRSHFADSTIYLLMGVFKDKQYEEIARIMRVCSDTIYCFAPELERGLGAKQLAEAVRPYYREVFSADSAEDAVKQVFLRAKENEDRDTIIVSFGSLSTIDAVQNAVMHMDNRYECTERGAAWTG